MPDRELSSRQRWLALLLLVVAALAPGGCADRSPVGTAQDATAAPGAALPRSEKGYELYGWPAGDEWGFTLITGSNRAKSMEEIMAGGEAATADGWARITVTGLQALKAALGRLPKGEVVIWVDALGWERLEGSGPGYVQPDPAMMESIRGHCRQMSIDLLEPPMTESLPAGPVLQSATPDTKVGDWAEWRNERFHVELRHPPGWTEVPGYEGQRRGAADGFVQCDAMDGPASVDDAARQLAGHKLQPYGSSPSIEILSIAGQPARMVLPSADQSASMPGEAALVVRYPEPADVGGTRCDYLILYGDAGHIRAIAGTLRFLAR